jgi:hypothetical protein
MASISIDNPAKYITIPNKRLGIQGGACKEYGEK